MFNLLDQRPTNVKNDILSGITVALALVPEAVAFAFIAGLEPMVGLYAAFMMGLVTSIFGGRPGMISGATGATAVVMVSLVLAHGAQYLFAAVFLAGVLQILAGVLKLGKFIRIVPHPVMLGFVNGLAIVIFLSQLGLFEYEVTEGVWNYLQGEELLVMGTLIVATMLIMQFLPKFTKAVPAGLVAIVSVTLAVVLLDLPARSVIDFVADKLPESEAASASLQGTLPSFAIPLVPFTLETLWIILPYSAIIAAVGLIESLLTLSLIDELTNTRGRGNKECIGQGLANSVNGVFGGMGGCAMIGQSMININNGGRGRLSGITAALVLLGFILFAAPLIEMIPLAALVGVMFMVVLGTFEWSSLRIIRKIPITDAFVIILVSGITVAFDLAIAVIVGVIVSALVFAWKHAQHIYADVSFDNEGRKIYDLRGPVFFGSVSNFKDIFDIENDPKEVIIEFRRSRVSDHSGIDALDTIAEKYQAAGKNLHLRHLSPECRELLEKAGDLCEINVLEDPTYHVASDKLA
ncbi:SulP family inorganic anion transporter [Sessilibacter corallicola]|uniref:SulP family inorganic anion transporter n=1 Tax=Sessilibacter corallicola TaxID=2904075 RepID=A0ABQ0ADQ6_9GAMM|nr:SulP family inorganic anion transporter [Sessilibacter corallicola]MCE2027365.1 SulP family inorganic anion transporter [Sessilibacter corallicola]